MSSNRRNAKIEGSTTTAVPFQPYPNGYTAQGSCKACVESLLPECQSSTDLISAVSRKAEQALTAAATSGREHTFDETFALAAYTCDVRMVGLDDEHNLWLRANRLMRKRDARALQPYHDWLYYLFAGLRKIPPEKLTVWRGLHHVGLASDEGQKYGKGCEVCWVAFSSTTTSQSVMEDFADGGAGSTLLRIEVTGARSVSQYSLIPDEAEYLLLPNTVVEVVTALSAAERKLMKTFEGDHSGLMSRIPESVDLVVLQQRETPEYADMLLQRCGDGTIVPGPPECRTAGLHVNKGAATADSILSESKPLTQKEVWATMTIDQMPKEHVQALRDRHLERYEPLRVNIAIHPMHMACYKGEIPSGSDWAACVPCFVGGNFQSSGWTVAHAAALFGNKAALRACVEAQGAHWVAGLTTNNGFSVLHAAAQGGWGPELCEYLLREVGCDPSQTFRVGIYKDDTTPLAYAACLGGNVPTIQWVQKHSGHSLAFVNPAGYCNLLAAVLSGNETMVSYVERNTHLRLETCGNTHGSNAAHFAILSRDVSMLNLVLKRGVAISAKTTTTTTSLMFAAWSGSLEMLEKVRSLPGCGQFTDVNKHQLPVVTFALWSMRVDVIRRCVQLGSRLTPAAVAHHAKVGCRPVLMQALNDEIANMQRAPPPPPHYAQTAPQNRGGRQSQPPPNASRGQPQPQPQPQHREQEFQQLLPQTQYLTAAIQPAPQSHYHPAPHNAPRKQEGQGCPCVIS